MATAVSEANGANCPYGGVRVDAGVDSNSNGVLDPSEVSSVQYVCNGTPGANALTGLVRVVSEPAGTNCATGGSKVLAGLDSNRDAALNDAEVTSTSYVCAGANGSNGVNGTNGTDGVASLIAITAEPSGANCPSGGSKFTAGLDSNRNAVLDPGEVTSTSYTCNAPPAGLVWLDAPVSTTAIPNRGYFASGATRVAITLPASATPGDIISLSGTGDGGWTIAQTAGQKVLVRGVPLKLVSKFEPRSWTGVASSADGAKLVAVAFDDWIYVSSDFGETWSPRESVRSWNAVASSADGSTLLAGEHPTPTTASAPIQTGYIWRSVDSGVNWASTGTTGNWTSIAMTADGTEAYAVGGKFGNGTVWKSVNGGASWFEALMTPISGVYSVAVSADGVRVAAAGINGAVAIVYVSDNGGSTWTERFSMSSNKLPHVSMSADGSKLLLVAGQTWFGPPVPVTGRTYVSNDGGSTWTYAADAAMRGAVSVDGKTLWMVGSPGGPGGLTGSFDGGLSFGPVRTTSMSADSLALSNNGNRAVLAGPGSPIVTTRLLETTTGVEGKIDGEQFDAIELQYIGGGTYVARSFSTASGFRVR